MRHDLFIEDVATRQLNAAAGVKHKAEQHHHMLTVRTIFGAANYAKIAKGDPRQCCAITVALKLNAPEKRW